MKNPINALIQKTLKKASTKNLVQGFTKRIVFKGKEYELQLSRRFEPRHVSICDPSNCNAGDDCCHKGSLNGIALCYDGDSRWDVMDEKLGVIFAWMDSQKEEYAWQYVRRILDIMEGMDKNHSEVK